MAKPAPALFSNFQLLTPARRTLSFSAAEWARLAGVYVFVAPRTLVAGGLFLPSPAHAPLFPPTPVRLINCFAPVGPSYLLSLSVCDNLQGMWGQPVIVEAKPGADGLIGMEYAARSPADGYTLVTVPVGNAVLLPNLRSKLPYDMAKDFVPITMLATVQNVIVVGAAVPAGNVAELVALSKASPGKRSFAAPGRSVGGGTGGDRAAWGAGRVGGGAAERARRAGGSGGGVRDSQASGSARAARLG